MRALVVDRNGRLSEEVRDDPSPDAGEVRVRVGACGLCGSDLSLLEAGPAIAGRILGHEISGRFEFSTTSSPEASEASASSSGVVAVLPAPRCDLLGVARRCRQCERGQSHLCSLQPSKSLGISVDGGFAEYVVVHKNQCFDVPEGVPQETAALAEPLAVAIHALDVAQATGAIDNGLAVVGAGPIGLLIMLLARSSGMEVTVIERNPYRRSLARRLGASEVAPDWNDRKLGSFSTVMECTGSADAVEEAVLKVEAGGRVVLVGAPKPQSFYRIQGLFLLVREVKLLPAMAYTTEEFRRAVGELGAAPDYYGQIITHAIPLDAAASRLPALIESGEFGKVVITPDIR